MTFLIRAYVDADDVPVSDLQAKIFAEFPVEAPAERRRRREEWVTYHRPHRLWVAEHNGALAGWAMIISYLTQSGGDYYAGCFVHPDCQRQGGGSALFDQILAVRAEVGYRRLITQVMDNNPAASAFAQRHGFEFNGRGEQLSRLNVPTVNLAGTESVERDLSARGITISLVQDIDRTDAFMRALYELDQQTHRDIPSAQSWSDTPYDEWLDVLVLGAGRSPKWAWVAIAGDQPVGICRLRINHDGKTAFNAYTGTAAAFRGRGIARALKNRSVLWCRENGVDWIYTGNEIANHGMLAINRSLGYESLPREMEMVRDFE